MKRTWVKLFCTNWLDGTLRKETAEIRGVWADIIALAGEMVGDTGILSFAVGVGFSDGQFAARFNLQIDQWKKCKLRLAKIGCIDILGDNVISVRNWKKYQSEYQRQKPNREEAFQTMRNPILERDEHSCQECGEGEGNDVTLCIHHIDNDKENNSPDNLITLCRSCHSKLYKKAVHKTKEVERLNQAEHFQQLLLAKSAANSSPKRDDTDVDVDVDLEVDLDLDLDSKNILYYSEKDLRPSVAPLVPSELAVIDNTQPIKRSTRGRPKLNGNISPAPDIKKRNDYSDEFGRFWQIYPRRVVKGVAGKCFDKLVMQEKIDPELLITCAKNYADYVAGKDPQFILHPATFLSISQRRWEDFITPLVEKAPTPKFSKEAQGWLDLVNKDKTEYNIENIIEGEIID